MTTLRMSRPDEADRLYDVWLRAVTATHTFLAPDDLAYFAGLVREYLPGETFWVAEVGGMPVAFMALDGENVDALFVDPDHHGTGIGRALIEKARELAGPLTVEVNEQNEGAHAFYRRMGFELVKRTELDGYGKPYPTLYLAQAPVSP
jgi:putative acetyltransferase